MSIQQIDIGTVANDLSGDALRDAFDIINRNFSELDSEKASDADVAVAVNNHAVHPSHLEVGGTTGQVTKKKSNANFDTEWSPESSASDDADRAEQAADSAEASKLAAATSETNAAASAVSAAASAAAACDPSAHSHTIAQITDLSNQLGACEKTANKGTPDGYPPLDGSGLIPVSYIPQSVTGEANFISTWNADTNTPTVPAASSVDIGDYYIVSVAGTTDLDGIASWAVGDQVISSGTVWQKIPSTQQVISVNGADGVVVLDTDDIAEGASNEYYTDAKVDARITYETLDTAGDVGTGAGQLAIGNHTHTSSAITDFTTSVDARVTYETLDTAGDVGTGAGQLAIGNHTHTASNITDFTTSVDARVTYETLDTAGDVGTGAAQLAIGNHTHVEADITDLDKYTQAEVDTAIAAATGADLVVQAPTAPDLEGTHLFWIRSAAGESPAVFVKFTDANLDKVWLKIGIC